MNVYWTSRALSDVSRLFEFLAPVNKPAAVKVIRTLTSAPDRLMKNPRIGERLDEFAPRDVRRILVGHYELRYELKPSEIYVLRVWHTREDR